MLRSVHLFITYICILHIMNTIWVWALNIFIISSIFRSVLWSSLFPILSYIQFHRCLNANISIIIIPQVLIATPFLDIVNSSLNHSFIHLYLSPFYWNTEIQMSHLIFFTSRQFRPQYYWVHQEVSWANFSASPIHTLHS